MGPGDKVASRTGTHETMASREPSVSLGNPLSIHNLLVNARLTAVPS